EVFATALSTSTAAGAATRDTREGTTAIGTAGSRALPRPAGAPRDRHRLEISGDLIHLPGRGVVMKDEESESIKIIENTFASAGLRVPALKDVLATLKIDRIRAQKIVTLLLRNKTLVKVSDELVFHQNA